MILHYGYLYLENYLCSAEKESFPETNEFQISKAFLPELNKGSFV